MGISHLAEFANEGSFEEGREIEQRLSICDAIKQGESELENKIKTQSQKNKHTVPEIKPLFCDLKINISEIRLN